LAVALQNAPRPENGDDRRRVRSTGAPLIERRRSPGRRRSDATPKVPCPHCGCSASVVTNSRPVLSRNGVKRRRQCDECGQRYTTIETIYATTATPCTS
jgi:hypothetical protein